MRTWMFLSADAGYLEEAPNLGLTTRFRSDEDVLHFIGMLDGLSFLPLHDVPEGMLYLRDNVREGFESLVDYFDQTYVTRSFRRTQQPPSGDGTVGSIRMRSIHPMYILSMWNVHDVTVNGRSRTLMFEEQGIGGSVALWAKLIPKYVDSQNL